MKKVYQTIIIGAGPAGLIAGQYLEDALILDKKKNWRCFFSLALDYKKCI